MNEQQEVREITERYRDKYGIQVDETLGGIIQEIKATWDVEGLACLRLHLLSVIGIIDEMATVKPVVVNQN